jgi:hypothetical protein
MSLYLGILWFYNNPPLGVLLRFPLSRRFLAREEGLSHPAS